MYLYEYLIYIVVCIYKEKNMIYLHKILPIFILPIMLIIIIILIGLFKNKKKIIYIGIGLLYIFSTPIFFNNFFKLIEGSEYRKPLNSINNADAIVVLSGMLGINEVGDSTYIEWGDPDRFFGGIELFKAGKAQMLVFTGGKLPWDKAKKTEGNILKKYAILNGIPNEKIYITKNVQNTEEEAKAVKELISPKRRIILVTSAFHMYRAKKLFEKEDLDIITYKVDYKVAGNSSITFMDFLPNGGSLNGVEIGFKEIIGRLFYLIKYSY